MSKTIIAAAIALVASLLQTLDITWDVAQQEGMGNALISAVAAGVAIWGRYVAKKDLQTGGALIKETTTTKL